MNIMESILNEYVLETAKLYQEFDISQFQMNSTSALSNKVEKINVKWKMNNYSTNLFKAFNILKGIELDKKDMNSFLNSFNKLDRLDSAQIYCEDINTNLQALTIAIKPQYLRQFSDFVAQVIENVLNGKGDNGAIEKFKTGEIQEKIEKQIVRTNFNYGLSTSQLLKEIDNKHMTIVDTLYVKNKVIPFINNFSRYKNLVIEESENLNKEIKNFEIRMHSIIKALNKRKEDESTSHDVDRVLNQLAYNSIRGMLDVVGFVTFMMIHKITSLVTCVVSVENLYKEIYRLYNGNSFSEGAFDGSIIPLDTATLMDDLIKGRSDGYRSVSDNVYSYHSALPNINDLDNNNTEVDKETDLENAPYDKKPFLETIKMLIMISNGLDIISSKSDDYLLIFDDIINEAGFTLRLDDRFKSTLDDIKDLSSYSNDSLGYDQTQYLLMLSEVKDFGNNMDKIANTALDVSTKIELLERRFSDNINGEFKDLESVNELRMFMRELYTQFEDILRIVSSNFIVRLKLIDEKLTSMETSNPTGEPESDYSIPATEPNVDFSESVYLDLIDEIEEDTQLKMEALELDYIKERERILKGVNLVIEADTNTTAVQSAAAQAFNSNKKETTPSSTSPKVVDNSEDAKPAASNKVYRWMVNKTNNFKTLINNSLSKGKSNIIYSPDNRNALLGRSYSNVTLSMYPFKDKPYGEIAKEIQNVTRAVSSLNTNVMNTIPDEKSLYKKIFTFVNVANPNTLSQDIEKWYKVGNNTFDVSTISNSDLKQMVSKELIPWCDNINSSYVTEITKLMLQLGEATDKVIMTFNDNGTPEGKIKPSEKAQWLEKSVEIYCAAIIRAMVFRTNQYFGKSGAVNKLLPEKKIATPNNQEEVQ